MLLSAILLSYLRNEYTPTFPNSIAIVLVLTISRSLTFHASCLGLLNTTKVVCLAKMQKQRRLELDTFDYGMALSPILRDWCTSLAIYHISLLCLVGRYSDCNGHYREGQSPCSKPI